MKPAKYSFMVAALIFISANVSAQIINPQKVLERKVTNKINKTIDKKTNQVVDSVFKPVEDPIQQNKKDIPPPVANKNNAPSSGNQPGLEAYSKYDFVPGEKVILFDDFSQDAVGDFPALWTANAAGEINTLNIAPGKWFNFNNNEGNYFLLKRIDFPKNFIIEFDMVPKKTGGRIAAGLILYNEGKPLEMDNNPHPGTNGLLVSIEKANWNTLGYKNGEPALITGSSNINPVEQEKVNHVIIWIQNRRLRIYHKMAKVLDMPTQIYDGTKFNRLCFRLSRGASCGAYISNLRITDASPDMRNKLLTEGKMISYGIYFDVNKDQVKPESYGTIKGIADVLTENASVKIKIIGHTDADGSDITNLDLSKRRAASVKNELVKTFGIDATRIETDGKGESQPIAPNDTPSNKALNRRVEFLKQ